MTYRQGPIVHARVEIYCDVEHDRHVLDVYELQERFAPPARARRPSDELLAEFPGMTYAELRETYEDDELLVSAGRSWVVREDGGTYSVGIRNTKAIPPEMTMGAIRERHGDSRAKVSLVHCGRSVKCLPESLEELLNATAAAGVSGIPLAAIERWLSKSRVP